MTIAPYRPILPHRGRKRGEGGERGGIKTGRGRRREGEEFEAREEEGC